MSTTWYTTLAKYLSAGSYSILREWLILLRKWKHFTRHYPKPLLATGILVYFNVKSLMKETMQMLFTLFLNRLLHRLCRVKNGFFKRYRFPAKCFHCITYISLYGVSHKWQHPLHFVIEFGNKFQ